MKVRIKYYLTILLICLTIGALYFSNKWYNYDNNPNIDSQELEISIDKFTMRNSPKDTNIKILFHLSENNNFIKIKFPYSKKRGNYIVRYENTESFYIKDSAEVFRYFKLEDKQTLEIKNSFRIIDSIKKIDYKKFKFDFKFTTNVSLAYRDSINLFLFSFVDFEPSKYYYVNNICSTALKVIKSIELTDSMPSKLAPFFNMFGITD